MVADYTTVRKKCDNCSRYSDMIMGEPMHCSSCNKNICIYCIDFGYCRTCWEKFTPEEQIIKKKEWRKNLGKSFFQIIIIAAIIFILYSLPVIFFRDNDPLFYTSIIGGTILLLILIFSILDYVRKKKGRTGLFEQLKKDLTPTQKMDDKSKKILKIVFLIFGSLILFIIIMVASIMSEFD